MSDEITKLTTHIRDRLAKSTLDSPSIHISRDGWGVILRAMEPQPIETAPRDETTILVWGNIRAHGYVDHKSQRDWEIGFWGETTKVWQCASPGSDATIEDVTHWMPLPVPPQE